MATDAEPPMRDQLVEARERIIAQIDEMNFRSRGFQYVGRGPPDYRGLIAELEGELREIDKLLGDDDSPDACAPW
jgi:hypothetical protein